MKMKDFFDQPSQNSISLKVVTVIVAMIWNIVFAILFTRLMPSGTDPAWPSSRSKSFLPLRYNRLSLRRGVR